MIKDVNNIQPLKASFDYFLSERQLYYSHPDINDESFKNHIKRQIIIQTGNELFFPDGILSQSEITVRNDDTLNKQQMKWWTKNKASLFSLFKERIPIDTQPSLGQLLKVIHRLNTRFFSHTLFYNLKSVQRRIPGGRSTYITASINNSTWIELYINASRLSNNITQQVMNQLQSFTTNKCKFTDLHDYDTIGDIITNTKNT